MTCLLIRTLRCEIEPSVLSHLGLDLLLLDLVLIFECLDLLFLLQLDFISVRALHPQMIGDREILEVIEVRVNPVQLRLLLLILRLLIPRQSYVVKRHCHFLLVVFVPHQVL